MRRPRQGTQQGPRTAAIASGAADTREIEEAFEEARRDVRYVVTDFPVDTFIQRFRDTAEAEGDIYVPDYQRTLIWQPAQQAFFIESLLLRIPVPPIFFYDIQGRLEIVDGSQRVRTMVSFRNDELTLEGLEKLDVLNGMRFSEMPQLIQRRFLNTPVRSFVLDQETEESTRINLFGRLNTTGKKLADAEVRKGVFRGPFLDLVIECAGSRSMLAVASSIAGRKDANAERQELVTRFFVYSRKYESFRHDVRKFLDKATAEFNGLGEGELEAMRLEFDSVMRFVGEHYPRGFYRTQTGPVLPRVRFEAVAVGTALALRSRPTLRVRSLDWLRAPEFDELVRTDASNSGPKLRGRVEYVRDHLLGR